MTNSQIRQAIKDTGASRHDVIAALVVKSALEDGRLKTNQVHLTQGAVSFTDENEGYEQLAQGLRTLGFDWKVAAQKGYEVDVYYYEQKISSGGTEPNQPCRNGTNATEFAVYAGIYGGLRKVYQHIKKVYGRQTVLLTMMTGTGIESQTPTVSVCLINK